MRSCADACCSLLVRRRGSIAPASAQSCKVHLSRLQHGLHNLPHSSKHVVVLELMLGCSRLDGRLPRGLPAWPVPLASDGTSSRVAGVAERVGSMGVSMGKVPGCHGGLVARWSWWERVCDAGTMRGRWHGSVVAERGLPAPLGGGSLVQWFHWFLAPIRFIGPGRQAHRGWSSSWCGVARPSLRSVQVV